MEAILFDLDGTLLPMDTKVFEKLYFSSLGDYFMDLIEKEKLIEYVWISTKKMLTNDGNKINRVAFEDEFRKYVNNLDEYMVRFNNYYETSFEVVKSSTRSEPLVKDIVNILKLKGYKLVLATNPLFPLNAVEKRIKWAGLSIDDFIHITHFDVSTSCKPRLSYYMEILKEINIPANNCYMIGNDTKEDMVASELGMKTFLVTPNLIQTSEQEKCWNHEGDYVDLYKWANNLPDAK